MIITEEMIEAAAKAIDTANKESVGPTFTELLKDMARAALSTAYPLSPSKSARRQSRNARKWRMLRVRWHRWPLFGIQRAISPPPSAR
jgi:hypothetical protein